MSFWEEPIICVEVFQIPASTVMLSLSPFKSSTVFCSLLITARAELVATVPLENALLPRVQSPKQALCPLLLAEVLLDQ